MARYRSKDDVDLAWNKMRRRITRELDLQIADWREEALNHLLAGAWEEFKKALSDGDPVELEAKYAPFVAAALSEVIDVKVDAAP